jgi:hypothetical protein
MRDIQRIKDRFPNITADKNKKIFGLQRMIDSNHSRLMAFRKDLMASLDNPDATTVIR